MLYLKFFLIGRIICVELEMSAFLRCSEMGVVSTPQIYLLVCSANDFVLLVGW